MLSLEEMELESDDCSGGVGSGRCGGFSTGKVKLGILGSGRGTLCILVDCTSGRERQKRGIQEPQRLFMGRGIGSKDNQDQKKPKRSSIPTWI